MILKKLLLTLPYLLMIFITPIYNILDKLVFVKVFGCGCVPHVQSNKFNIAFNANDLRIVAYTILVIAITSLGLVLSKKIKSKIAKIIYVASIFLVNGLLARVIINANMWM